MNKMRGIVFTGRVEGGKLALDGAQQFSNYIKKFEKKRVCLAIDQIKSTRTNQQNGYYWGDIIGPIMKEFGYYKDEMHDALKIKFLTKYNDSDLPTLESTSRLGRNEMGEYIENIRTWAMTEHHINLPTPEEYKLLHNLE